MATIVEYILNLKENLSTKVEGATVQVNKLEHSLKNVGEVIGVLGVSMAAFAGFEALKGAHEVWEKMEFSISQVEAGLKSTKGAAGLSFEEIQESAEKTAHSVKYAQSEILGMQSVLLTFPSITKDSFQPATDLILDMSTRLGQDLKGSAIQVGKALQDPIKGVTALRRVGVNFNETQTEIIKNLAETNHLAEAQGMIMKELNLEFGGSAQAAAAADAGFRYGKSLEEIRLEVGHLVDKLQQELMPVALKFLEWVKDAVDWIKKNATAIASWTKAIAAGLIVFKAMSIAIAAWPAILAALEAAAYSAMGGMSALGASFVAALSPIALIAVAVGGLVLLFEKLGDNITKANEARNKFLDTSVDKEVTYLEEVSASYGGGQKGKDRAAEQEKENLKSQLADLEKSLVNAQGDRAKEINDQRTEVLSKMNAVDRFQQGLIPSGKPKAGATMGEKVDPTPKTKATGSKSVTINVSIKELIHEYSNNITNVKEMGSKIRDHVVAALTGAVNDFQITAGA